MTMIISQKAKVPFKTISKRFNAIKLKVNPQDMEQDLEEPKTKIIAPTVKNELVRQLKSQARGLGANAILNFKVQYEFIQDTVELVIYGIPAVLTNEKLAY